jgi:hypothetical protein
MSKKLVVDHFVESTYGFSTYGFKPPIVGVPEVLGDEKTD